MESKHTPLPWEVHKLSHCQDELWLQIGYNGKGPIVRLNCTAEPMCPRGGPNKIVSSVCESKYMAIPEEEQIANAEFIVKACNSYYDMLEALENLHEQLWKHHKMDVKKDYSLMVADAAAVKVINKVKGE